MYINKSTKVMIASCALLFLLGGILHYVDIHAENLPFRLSAISYVAYCTICILALIYTNQNIPRKETRDYMMVGIWLLLFWQLDTMVEQMLFPAEHVVNRALWYVYYIPTLMIPNLLLMSSLTSNANRKQEFNKAWYGTYAISGVIILIILTNDYHGLAFGFPMGIENFHLSYNYQAVYYVAMVWMYILFFASAFFMIKGARERLPKRKVMLIFVGLGLSIFYFIWYALGRPFFPWINDMYGVPEVFLGITTVTIAVCIATGLIRANFNFLELFEASDLTAVLVDYDGRVRYKTHDAIATTLDQRTRAINDNIYIDKNLRLEGQRIEGGYVYWVNDISDINDLREELSETHDHLEQDNSLINAENVMIARMSKADEQNRLYSLMARSVEPELNKIKQILSETEPKNPDFSRKIAEACIYNAYVKRCCNLNLLKQDNHKLNSFDLESSIRESLEYIRLNGILCEYQCEGSGFYDSDGILLAYNIFQQLVEKSYDAGALEHVKVVLASEINFLTTELTFSWREGESDQRDNPQDIIDRIKDRFDDEIMAMGGSLELYLSGSEIHGIIKVPGEGKVVK